MFINYLIGFFVFLFGLCMGSFLNCAIYRLEQQKKMSGRSFCPHCKHMLSWQDLFPVFSFLFLKGKCRYCHKKISIQYPLVELLTGILFVLLFGHFYSGLSLRQVIYILYLFYISSALIVIFIYDLKHSLIPEAVLFPAAIVAIIYNLLPPYNMQYILFSLLATLAAGAFFFLLHGISKGKAMGFGDVELVVLMGIFLGWPNLFTALFLAFFFGAIIGLILMALPARAGGEKKSLKSEIPFGPFLITGTFMALFLGSQIIKWYLNFFQI
jgi:leader peptidase (prepilin peptidase) / N-methyltransferase